MTSIYTDRIRALEPDYDPRHIEAYMRVEHGTLDHLDARRFADEAHIAARCVEIGGVEKAEELAGTYGLLPPATQETMPWRVETFGRDCYGNITGYRVVRGHGFTLEFDRSYAGNIYRPASFDEARQWAEDRCRALNDGSQSQDQTHAQAAAAAPAEGHPTADLLTALRAAADHMMTSYHDARERNDWAAMHVHATAHDAAMTAITAEEARLNSIVDNPPAALAALEQARSDILGMVGGFHAYGMPITARDHPWFEIVERLDKAINAERDRLNDERPTEPRS